MKSFLKYTLATIVGFIIVNIFIFFIVMGVIGAIASMGDKPVEVKDNSILLVKFSGNIPDRTSNNPFESIDFSTFKPVKSIGLNKIVESIQKAAKDSRIKGIYLDLTDIQSNFGGMATTEEIRNALKAFKESGKFIYSYSNLGYSQKAYYLATIADSIFVNPETPLTLTGMGGTMFFYKNTIEKLGLQIDIVKVGKYKSAVEPFTQTEMSDANREQVETYLRSLWGNQLTAIAESRHITPDTLNWLANNLEFRSTETEKSFGLYDGVVYEDEMIGILKKRCGVAEDGDLYYTPIADYQKISLPGKIEFSKDKIAVIYAQGSIGMEQSSSAIGPELAQTIRKIRKDDNVKAIVMRVNSPGGSALTSDIIWREVKLAAEAKPFIVSMGNVAASGGYYIACAADTIVADPMTLTGSIGIFGHFFSGEKLIKDKMGITSSVVKTNEHSDFGGGYPLPLPISNRPLTDYEKNVLQKFVEKGYETFLNRVATGRHMTRDEVHEIAQGRVWTGADALNIGLVDILGGMDDAIKIAATKAGLDKYNTVDYPVEKNPFEELFSGFSASIRTSIMKNEMGVFYDSFSKIKEMDLQQGLVARIPYDVELN